MIDMVRRHEIQVQRQAGHSLAETATLVGASQSSVQRITDRAARRARNGVTRGGNDLDMAPGCAGAIRRAARESYDLGCGVRAGADTMCSNYPE